MNSQQADVVPDAAASRHSGVETGAGEDGGRARMRGVAMAVVALAAALAVAGVIVYRSPRSEASRSRSRTRSEQAAASPSTPHVLLVGDSVTYMSGGPIGNDFGRADVHLIAVPGQRTQDMLPLMREWMDGPGASGVASDDVGILIGYNDVLRYTLGSRALPEMVDLSSRFRCAVWLELPARPGHQTSTNAKFPSADVDTWNLRLRHEVVGHRSIHLVDDWKRAVEADRSLVVDDFIHPTARGRIRLGAIYRAAIERECGPAPVSS
jgi:hypothetical protein